MRRRHLAGAAITAAFVTSLASPAFAQTNITQITDSNVDSYDPEITADGRYVSFWTFDTSLPGVTTGLAEPGATDAQLADVVLYDTQSRTFRVLTPNTNVGGNENASISQDGTKVVWDYWGGGNPSSRSVAIFDVASSALVNADAGLANDDYRFPSVSNNGSVVAFQSGGEFVGNIFVKSGAGAPTAITSSGQASRPAVSGDGLFVVYAENGAIVRQQLSTGTTTVLSVDATVNRTPEINLDGTVVVWERIDTVDAMGVASVSQLMRWVQGTGTAALTNGDRTVDHPSVSADGTEIVFNSKSTNLGVDNPFAGNDIFLWRQSTNAISLVVEGDDDSYHATINDPGTLIGFRSVANNFGTDSVESARDIYVTVGPRGTVANLPAAPLGAPTPPPPTPPSQRARCLSSPPDASAGFQLSTGDSERNRLYRTYCAALLRDPDMGGFNYWLGVRQRGFSWQNLSLEFAVSPEFVQRYGTLSNEAFITRLYRDVMDRASDTGGQAYWTDLLNRGVIRRGEALFYFSDSQEFRNITKTG